MFKKENNNVCRGVGDCVDKMDLEFEAIYQKVLVYIHKQEDLLGIKHAYNFVKVAFDGILRKDGNPFLKHLLDTADIVVDLQAGPNTIIAALLHDSIEDIEDITYDTVCNKFSKDISDSFIISIVPSSYISKNAMVQCIRLFSS